MAAIKVLVVADGPYMNQVPPSLGINLAPAQDSTDNTFTISEFLWLLRNNGATPISVDTAHRHNDPNATYPNFTFTAVDLSQYDVLWLFGYEGFNADYYGSAIGDDEVQAVANFMANGGGVFATGDHSGMGSFMCGLIPRVRSMRKWFGQAGDLPAGYPTTAVDSSGTVVTAVNWPGGSSATISRADTLQPNPSDSSTMFQFDDQSDGIPQPLSFPDAPVHPVLQGSAGPINRFPDHMHEGEVVTPSNLGKTLVINGQSFMEYPANGAFQPAPAVIATGAMIAGHGTLVLGATCEINNFVTDDTPTVARTLGILCAYDGHGVGVGRVLTDSSFHHYLDLNLVGDPCGSSPDRQQGFGPAYTSPAAGSVLADLQAFYVNAVIWLARPEQSFYFSVDKSTFGFDESSADQTYPSFGSAFWLVVNGYTPNQVQDALSSGALVLSGPFANVAGLTAGALLTQGTGGSNAVQRVLIPYAVQFSSSSIGSFPITSNPPVALLLEASLAIGGTSYVADTVFELAAGADPYFQNIGLNASNAFYLSQDLCVFTVTPGLDPAPVAGVTFQTANPFARDDMAAFTYIGGLLGQLNVDSSFTTQSTTSDPFASFPSQFITNGDSSVTPITVVGGEGFTNYNFAIARVRLNGPVGTSAQGVRVFFRVFITQTSDTDYEPSGSYLSTFNGVLPETPLPAPDGETTPFFASGSGGGDYAAGGPNNRPITVEAPSGAWAYFGCYLDVYDPALNLQATGTHHCIVAQIAYDDAPIVNANGVTASPGTSDKLAQRNMQVTFSGNPSAAASHWIPQTFDLRGGPTLSATAGTLLDVPDELMIDWGNTPPGSIASIYWPQAQAADVLRLASRLYASTSLSMSDPNTLQCVVPSGVTYVPIPSSTGKLAGLLTIDLPSTVVRGEEFNLVARRLSSRRSGDPTTKIARTVGVPPKVGPRSVGGVQRNWRYIVGTFAVKIPVAPERSLRAAEENTYAILLWRLSRMAPTNRWVPVLRRYLSIVAARVNAFGGSAAGILPSPAGAGAAINAGGGPHHPGHAPGHGGHRPHEREFTGKISVLVYDRFGDFEGFRLRTQRGDEHAFEAAHAELEELARAAWKERMLISVIVDEDHPHRPVRVMLRRLPLRPRG